VSTPLGVKKPLPSFNQDQCCDFTIFLPKNSEKFAFFAQTTASFCKILNIIFVLEKNANFSTKIGENGKS
jgi:hypothetical protein